MKKDEVVKRLCLLSTKVGHEVFKDKYAHDCICYSTEDDNSFDFGEPIIEFIEDATNKVMKHYRNESKEIDSSKTKVEYIQQIKEAQVKLNNLLKGAYTHKLRYEISINNPMGIENDTRTVVGITLFNNDPIYNNDGVC